MNNNPFIYLNSNSKTCVSKLTIEKIGSAMNYLNPSDLYSNVESKHIQTIKNYINNLYKLNNEFEIIFTSGGSEANSIFFESIIRSYISEHRYMPKIFVSEIEHSSIMKKMFNLKDSKEIVLEELKVITDGTKDLGAIDKNYLNQRLVFHDNNALILSVMAANNVTGVVNNLKYLGNLCKEKGIIFHTDAVQYCSKYTLDVNKMNIDAFSIAFQKLHGPQLGALIIKKSIIDKYKLKQYSLISGTQNNCLRGGSINYPYIIGAYYGMRETYTNRTFKNKKLNIYKDYILKQLDKHMVLIKYSFWKKHNYNTKNGSLIYLNSSNKQTMPNTLYLIYKIKNKHFCNKKVQMHLAEKNIYIGTGSACNSKDSYLFPMIPEEYQANTFRISISDSLIQNTKIPKEIDIFILHFVNTLQKYL